MLTAGARGELVANRLHSPEPSERVIVDPQGREGPGMTAGRSKRHLERRDRLRCSPQAGVDNPEVQGRQKHRGRKPRSPLEWRGRLLPPPRAPPRPRPPPPPPGGPPGRTPPPAPPPHALPPPPPPREP